MNGARPLRAERAVLGWSVAGGLAALVFGTLAAVVWQARGFGALGVWDLRAVWFTLWQAVVSATLSAALAVPVARALARRRFVGRGLLVSLMGAPFILPVIVAVMGLVTVFGRNGAINDGLAWLGLDRVSIYGWPGVILAHVFFNLPLSVRLILQGWAAIPGERVRLAQSLGFGPKDMARHVEYPMLRMVLPGVWLAVFLVCLTSFTVALALGGGPRATTVELAIYQAFRFDGDLGRAAVLALVQVGLCLVALALSYNIKAPEGFGAGLDRRLALPAPDGWRRWGDGAAITLAALFLIWPLAAVVMRGAGRLGDVPPTIWTAAGRSVVMALISALVTVSLALTLSLAVARTRSRLMEAAGMVMLVVSPLVLGTGLYLILRGVARPDLLALPVTVVVNAAMALPFALRTLLPESRALVADYGRLAASLGMTGGTGLRLLILPRLSRALGFAGGLAAALAMGDLGVITLFGGVEHGTLPLLLFQLMGAYRMKDAAAAAVVLMAISFALFWLCDIAGRRLGAGGKDASF